VYNKPNGCSATGALAPGPDHQQQPSTTFISLRLLVRKEKFGAGLKKGYFVLYL
jgi:hypothetical protein